MIKHASKLDSSLAFLVILVMGMYLKFADVVLIKLCVQAMLIAQFVICATIGHRLNENNMARKIALVIILGGLIFVHIPIWYDFKNIDPKLIYMPIAGILLGALIWALIEKRDVNNGRDRRKGSV